MVVSLMVMNPMGSNPKKHDELNKHKLVDFSQPRGISWRLKERVPMIIKDDWIMCNPLCSWGGLGQMLRVLAQPVHKILIGLFKHMQSWWT